MCVCKGWVGSGDEADLLVVVQRGAVEVLHLEVGVAPCVVAWVGGPDKGKRVEGQVRRSGVAQQWRVLLAPPPTSKFGACFMAMDLIFTVG